MFWRNVLAPVNCAIKCLVCQGNRSNFLTCAMFRLEIEHVLFSSRKPAGNSVCDWLTRLAGENVNMLSHVAYYKIVQIFKLCEKNECFHNIKTSDYHSKIKFVNYSYIRAKTVHMYIQHCAMFRLVCHAHRRQKTEPKHCARNLRQNIAPEHCAIKRLICHRLNFD